MDGMDGTRVFQVGDAARALKLTPSGVRWLVDTGALPAFRTPAGQRLLREADVLALMARRQQEREAGTVR